MPGLIERYRGRLPFADGDPVVSLDEGSTPLVRAPTLSEQAGVEVWLKLEGANPTGSFKDRGMTCAVSDAVRNGAEALEIVRELTRKHPIALVNSVNPLRLEGQKTAAFEVTEQLGEIDGLCIPVGNAGNITAYWKGFGEDGQAPKMLGFQAEGAAPLVLGHRVERPETVASAIRIGNPARWEEAMAAVTQSGGGIEAVSDNEILAAYRLLASREGIFCEPASAASVAGLLKHGARGASRVVCVLTGHGLKDPQTALEQSGSVVPCEPTLEAVEQAIDAVMP